MPPKSKKQKKFMQAVANNPKFAKKVGVPTKVGKEFTKETKVKKKVKKYEDGGDVARSPRKRSYREEMFEGLQKAMDEGLLDTENLRELKARDVKRMQDLRDARGMFQQKAHERRMGANLDSAIKGEEAKAAAQARAAQAKPPMRKGMSLEEATRLGAPIAAGAQLRGMMPPPQERSPYDPMPPGMKKGGAVKSKSKSKSKSKTNCRRGDGICKQGKTKGRIV